MALEALAGSWDEWSSMAAALTVRLVHLWKS